MARNYDSSFNGELELDDSVNEVFDEVPGNSFLALRRLRWSESKPFKLDIRKWYTNNEGEEVPGKGISFMTEEGPANLIEALLKNGYGDTKKTLNGLKDREDFLVSVKSVLTENGMDLDSVNISLDQIDNGSSFYDPKNLF